MVIKDLKSIKEIQDEFSEKFSLLKIEFYKSNHELGEGNSNDEKIDSSLLLKNVREIHKEGDLSINGHLKVATLENNFKNIFGVNVQVFRKSRGVWLQTITTDDWTLSEQQKEAEEMEQ